MPSLESRFLALLPENYARISRICRVYAWTTQDREDLYQEILFQIWRGLPNLKEDSLASTWIYRVAINTGISFVRKSRSGRKVIPVPQSSLLDCPDRNQRAGSDQHNPTLDALYDALAKLNKVERAAVTLLLEGLSYQEIAEVMGTNANQVGVLLHRTKKRISELMQEVAE